MKIIACYKCVPFDDSIGIKADRTLDMSTVTWEIGQYDLNAIEAGMQLASSDGDSVSVITVNGEVVSNSKMRKAVLSRGPGEMFGIQDESLVNADSFITASVLKAGIEKIGDVDIVICGEGSGDMYAQQTGNILGALLGWTTINAVSSVTRNGNTLNVERVLDDGVEVIEASTPLVITVTGDINRPRIPTMRDILGAGKKPATVWELKDVISAPAATTMTISVLAPVETGRQKIIFDGSEESVEKFIDCMRQAL